MFKRFTKLFTLSFTLLLSTFGFAQEHQNVPGKGYALIEPAVPSMNGKKDKIEVIEVFSYGCRYCYNLEPYLAKWEKTQADAVDLVRLPIPGERMNEIFTKTYYSLLALDKVDEGHIKFFDSIMDRNRYTSAKAVAQFMEKSNIASADEFLKAWDSFAVKVNYNKAEDYVFNKYMVTHTPVIIVDGRFFLDITTANTLKPNADDPYQQTIDVLDELIEEIKAERDEKTQEEE